MGVTVDFLHRIIFFPVRLEIGLFYHPSFTFRSDWQSDQLVNFCSKVHPVANRMKNKYVDGRKVRFLTVHIQPPPV